MRSLEKLICLLIVCVGIALDIEFPHVYYSFQILALFICNVYMKKEKLTLFNCICDFVIAPILVKIVLIFLFS